MSGGATIRSMEHGHALALAEDPSLQLTRIFVYFLQNLFREAPEGMGMKWRPNEETTELIISDQKPRLDAAEKKPHITCVFGAGQWAGLGLDQMQNRKILSTGERTHTDLVSSTIAYHCQAREGLHARRLAWNASYFTNVYRRVIMKGGGLHHVGVRHQVGAESGPTAFTGPLVEDKVVSVVATIPFYWQPQWLITDPSHVWRRMVMTFDISKPAKRYSAGEAAQIKRASMYGRPVEPVQTQPEEPSLTQEVVLEKYAGEE